MSKSSRPEVWPRQWRDEIFEGVVEARIGKMAKANDLRQVFGVVAVFQSLFHDQLGRIGAARRRRPGSSRKRPEPLQVSAHPGDDPLRDMIPPPASRLDVGYKYGQPPRRSLLAKARERALTALTVGDWHGVA